MNIYIYIYLNGLVDIKPENLEKIKKWQIKHLLTYSCGYPALMFSKNLIANIPQTEYLNYVLNYDLVSNAGEKCAYNNAESFLLSVVYTQKFGESILEFIRREIFEPLNIVNYKWISYDKYCAGCTGLSLKHRDLFKIGQLILNQGKFNSKQIISQQYIQEMCSTKMYTPNAVKLERLLPKYAVGYIMYISRDGYVYKDGSNGQYIIINLKKKQLITILSHEEDMSVVTEVLRGVI